MRHIYFNSQGQYIKELTMSDQASTIRDCILDQLAKVLSKDNKSREVQHCSIVITTEHCQIFCHFTLNEKAFEVADKQVRLYASCLEQFKNTAGRLDDMGSIDNIQAKKLLDEIEEYELRIIIAHHSHIAKNPSEADLHINDMEYFIFTTLMESFAKLPKDEHEHKHTQLSDLRNRMTELLGLITVRQNTRPSTEHAKVLTNLSAFYEKQIKLLSSPGGSQSVAVAVAAPRLECASADSSPRKCTPKVFQQPTGDVDNSGNLNHGCTKRPSSPGDNPA